MGPNTNPNRSSKPQFADAPAKGSGLSEPPEALVPLSPAEDHAEFKALVQPENRQPSSRE